MREIAMESAVIRRGIIQAFNPADWTATVQVLPSQGNYLTGVQVAKHVQAAEIAAGDQCALLFFNELNPADALVLAVYSVPSAPPGSSGGLPPLVDTNTSTVTITNTSLHVLNTLNVQLSASTTLLIVGTIHFRYGASSAGLHVSFWLDGAVIGPSAPISGNDMLVSQTSEAQQFTCAFYQTIAAGSHTLQLQVAEAISPSTATIYWSQLALKA